MDQATKVKVEALFSRATHEGTPVEEARTSAMICLRLLKAQGYRFDGQASADPGLARKLAESQAANARLAAEILALRNQAKQSTQAPPQAGQAPKPEASRWLSNKFPARCKCCGRSLPRGTWVLFERPAGGKGTITCQACVAQNSK